MRVLLPTLFLVACSSQAPVKSSGEPASLEVEAKAPTESPEAAKLAEPAPSPEPAKIDLRTLVPGFPALVGKVDGLEPKIETKGEIGRDGLPMQFTLLVYEAGGEKLKVTIEKSERLDTIERNRSKVKAAELVVDKKAEGALVYATRWASDATKCSMEGFVRAGGFMCEGHILCEHAEALATACVSLTHTGEGRTETKQAKDSFGLEDADAELAAWKVAKAIADDNPDALLKLWPTTGIKIHGRRVKPDEARKLLSKKPGLVKLLKIPCPPGLDDDGHGCHFQAHADDKEREDRAYLTIFEGAEVNWELHLRRDKSGSWIISHVPSVTPYH